MTTMFLGALATMHYHHMIIMLTNFKECSRVATIMGYDALVTSIQPVLKLFEHQWQGQAQGMPAPTTARPEGPTATCAYHAAA